MQQHKPRQAVDQRVVGFGRQDEVQNRNVTSTARTTARTAEMSEAVG
jgi:hypothetical protein